MRAIRQNPVEFPHASLSGSGDPHATGRSDIGTGKIGTIPPHKQ